LPTASRSGAPAIDATWERRGVPSRSVTDVPDASNLNVTATVAMVVISLVGRYATVVRFTFFEETSAGTSQEHEDAEQLLHSILKVKGRRFEHARGKASGLPRPERRIEEEADAGPEAPCAR